MNKISPAPEWLKLKLSEANGWLTFEQFMGFALYHPVHGYYTRQIRAVGRQGDFSTSAMENSLLGRALSNWMIAQKRRLRLGLRWHIIEIGGGTGEMAFSILKSMGTMFRLGVTYHLVEISKPLRELQQQKLKSYRVQWHATAKDALLAAQGRALIFSNELIDAFPCRRLRNNQGKWEELGVEAVGPDLKESARSLPEAELESLCSTALHSKQTDIKNIEVHYSYRDELRRISEYLVCGVLLTIDYGNRYPDLYYRQPAGTIRGYFHHQRVDGEELYQRIGKQDLTADVNFSDLERWGSDLGFKNEYFVMQRDFILKWIKTIPAKNTSDARLLDPIGAGGAFKVLEQSFGTTGVA